MIGNINPHVKKTIVIGAGISGLIAAFHLKKYGYDVEVYEKENRSGGLISTTQILGSDGELLGLSESAAHSIMATNEVISFFDELGIEYAKLNGSASNRYVLIADLMKRIPFEVLGIFDFIYLLIKIIFKPFFGKRDLNMREWGEYFLGTKATKFLLASFVSGIYGVKPELISVRMAFPKLKPIFGLSLFVSFLLRKYFESESKKTGRSSMIAPKYGMQDVVDKLRSNVGIVHTKTVENLNDFNGKNIFICTDATNALKLIGLSDVNINYTSMTTVTAIVLKSELKIVPSGVGVLKAEDANNTVKCIGVLFNSSSFEGRVQDDLHESFTLMYPDLEVSKEDVAHDLSVIFGYKTITGDNVAMRIHPVPRALPVYDSNLECVLKKIRTRLPSNTVLFSNYTGEVSIRGLIETMRREIPYSQVK